MCPLYNLCVKQYATVFLKITSTCSGCTFPANTKVASAIHNYSVDSSFSPAAQYMYWHAWVPTYIILCPTNSSEIVNRTIKLLCRSGNWCPKACTCSVLWSPHIFSPSSTFSSNIYTSPPVIITLCKIYFVIFIFVVYANYVNIPDRQYI